MTPLNITESKVHNNMDLMFSLFEADYIFPLSSQNRCTVKDVACSFYNVWKRISRIFFNAVCYAML
jgi:hypothetical protein